MDSGVKCARCVFRRLLAVVAFAMLGWAAMVSSAQAPSGQWAWMGGGQTACPAQCGNHGTGNQFSAAVSPGSRGGSVTWTDSSGNLWLFGGLGYDDAGNWGSLGDLLEFSPSQGAHGEWAWISGDASVPASCGGVTPCSPPGVYGTKYQFADANQPGGRQADASWTDQQGRLWLYGGYGADSTGVANYLDDLWVFDPAQGSHGEWAWMGGNSTTCSPPSCNPSPVYGTEYQFSANSTPGARQAASISWTDAAGRMWLFAGQCFGSSSNAVADCGDLWAFDPAQGSHGEWAWMGGTALAAPGVYGTQYQFAPGNFPQFRYNPTTWTDKNGNLWLFGGELATPRNYLDLNDLWEFDATQGAHGEWAWMGGSDELPPTTGAGACWDGFICGLRGVYGTKYTFAPGHQPGGRYAAAGWVDDSGRLWLLGGSGIAEFGSFLHLNDLWVFDPAQEAHGDWAWVGGNATGTACSGGLCASRPGIYGTQFQFSADNIPGGRSAAYGVTGSDGNLWLFGGTGEDASGGDPGNLNDVWELRLTAPQTISFPTVTATYGTAPISLPATSSSGLPVSFSLISGPATVSGTNGSTLTVTGAGAVVVAANQAGDSTTAPAGQVTQTITVKRALLQVVADHKTMKAGGPMANLTWHQNGLVNGDLIKTALTGWPVLTTDATPASPPGTYQIHVALGTLAAKNYTFQAVAGTLTITP